MRIAKTHSLAIAIALLLAPRLCAQGPVPIDDGEPKSVDPVVQLVLDSNPQTPPELMRAVDSLVKLGADEAARPLLEKLIAANLGQAQLAALARQFGSDSLLRLAGSKALQPESGKFAEAALEAFDQFTRDPARLAAATRDLSSPDAEVRRAARVDLAEGRDAAVAHLLSALADSERGQEHAAIAGALASLRSLARGPVTGALATKDPAFKGRVMRLLGEMGVDGAAILMTGPAARDESPEVQAAARDALLRILGAAPNRDQASQALRRQIDQYLRGVRPYSPDHRGLVTLWHWDDAARKTQPASYPADDVGILLAARLARDLYALNPDNASDRRLFLATSLEAAKIRHGFEKPIRQIAGQADGIYREASALGPEVVEDLLDFAVDQEMFGAAAAAAEILGETGSPAVLASADGRPRPLVRAVRSRDRRLRFAALAAVMKIRPREPFAGASHVPEALGFFAGTSGGRLAVIGHPRSQQGQNLLALLGPLGYDGEVAYRGRRLLEAAGESADVDLILVHMDIDRPRIREVLYQLRKMPQTGRAPIGIISSLDDLEEAQRLAYGDPLTDAFPRPHNAEAMEKQVARLAKHAGRSLISDRERRAQATASLGWLRELSETRRNFYDLIQQAEAAETALRVPDLAAAAAPVVANLGTASGQRALLNLASERAIPIETRQTAAKSFRDAVAAHGILLTTEEITRQYDRYNASETADAETQKVLGFVLDVIEAPSLAKAERGRRKAEGK